MLRNARSAAAVLTTMKAMPTMDLLSARCNSLQTAQRVELFGARRLPRGYFLCPVSVDEKADKDLDPSEIFYTSKTCSCSELDLVVKFGVLTDSQAFEAAAKEQVRQAGNRRYELSEAQTVMFLVQYGLQLSHPASGTGFELSVKDYLVLLLSACQFIQPTHDDLLRLAFPSTKSTMKSDDSTNSSSSNLQKNDWSVIKGVKVITAKVQLQAEQ